MKCSKKTCPNLAVEGIKLCSDHREASRQQYQRWLEKNRDKANAKSRRWYANNAEQGKATSRRWREANPHYERGRLYGVTPEQLEQLTAEHQGLCGICGGPMETPHVDHDHATGRVRGLLCPNCNRGLGMFKDNPEILEKAIKYLSRK